MSCVLQHPLFRSFNAVVCLRAKCIGIHSTELVNKCPLRFLVLHVYQSQDFPGLGLPPNSPTLHIVFREIKCSMPHICSTGKARNLTDMGSTESLYVVRPLRAHKR